MTGNNQHKSILAMDTRELQELVESLGEPSYRARQITAQLYHRLAFSYEEMTDLPVELRTRLAEMYSLHSLEPLRLAEARDGTIKGLFSLSDGCSVESTLMLYPRKSGLRGTVCVSTQVGCAVGCPFCATGQQGFERNLTSAEIIDQVLYFARRLRDRNDAQGNGPDAVLTNIVFMGMGEPLANYDVLLAAIRHMNSAEGLNIGARNMTISTAGLVPKIRELAGENLQVGLAVSLHAGTDELRNRLVPVNRTYPLAELMAACNDYFTVTGRRVSFEYTLFKEINDSPEDASSLGRLLRGMNCHVNLIPANNTGSSRYRPADSARTKAFLEIVRSFHVTTTVRQSRGQDIDAGCGQLRSRALQESGG